MLYYVYASASRLINVNRLHNILGRQTSDSSQLSIALFADASALSRALPCIGGIGFTDNVYF